MTKRSPRYALLALLCCTSTLAMACTEPSFDVDIPDGRSASVEEMAAAQAAVNEAVKAGEEYVNCVRENENRARADRLANATLDKMQALAANFNRQLRYHRRSN